MNCKIYLFNTGKKCNKLEKNPKNWTRDIGCNSYKRHETFQTAVILEEAWKDTQYIENKKNAGPEGPA